MNLAIEQNFELLDASIGGVTAGAISWKRSKLYFDATQFDGATFWLEMDYDNTDGAGRVISLLDETGSSVGTITATAGVTAQTRKRGASPITLTGAHTYNMQTPVCTTANKLHIWNFRIVVVQDATMNQTEIIIPMLNGDASDIWTTDLANPVDTTVSTTYTQNAPIIYPLWLFDATQWMGTTPGTPVTVEATFRTETAAQTASVALFDATLNSQVTGAVLTHTGDTAITNVTASFAIENLVNGHEYEFRMKCTGGAIADIYRASIRIDMANPQRLEVYTRISRRFSGTTSYTSFDDRHLWTAASYTSPTIYVEATGKNISGTTTWFLNDLGASDNSTSVSHVSGGGLTFTSTKARSRSGALTLTDTHRYGADAVVSAASNASDTQMWLIIQCDTINTLATQGCG